MKKSSLLILSFSIFLTSCNNSNSSENTSSYVTTINSCDITTSNGGTIEAFYSSKSLGVASSSSPLKLTNLTIGQTITLKASVDEGYKTSIATLNDSTIKGSNNYYSITIDQETNNVKFSFKLIETDINDFGFILDEDKKEASIVSYKTDEIPTPVILPTTYSKNGVSYKVTSIGEEAFKNVEATKITISSSITSIASNAFDSTYNLQYFNVDSASTTYKGVDGVLLSKDGTKLYAFPARYVKTSYEVPSSVTSIEPYAFYICRNLTNITFSSSLESIGKCAFYNAKVLKSLTFPSSLKTIGDYAFYQNAELTTVNMVEGLQEIGSSAFYGLVKLQSLSFPSSLKKIKDNAFYKCDKLSSITFKEGIEEIETLAFSNSINIKEIEFPSSLKIIGNSAFSACTYLESVTFKEGLQEIGNYAFALCSSIKSLTLPASVKKIGYNPFYAVLNLDATTFKVSSSSNYFVINDGVLFSKDLTTLICYPYGKQDESYVIPNSVTTLSTQSFSYINSLLELTIPTSVNRIDEAFYCVTSKLHITYLGTEAQFNNINKEGSNGYSWNQDAYYLTITYSDSNSSL